MTIVGISLGGGFAIRAAARQPRRENSLSCRQAGADPLVWLNHRSGYLDFFGSEDKPERGHSFARRGESEHKAVGKSWQEGTPHAYVSESNGVQDGDDFATIAYSTT